MKAVKDEAWKVPKQVLTVIADREVRRGGPNFRVGLHDENLEDGWDNLNLIRNGCTCRTIQRPYRRCSYESRGKSCKVRSVAQERDESA